MKFRMLACDKSGAETCASIVRDGGVAVFPTDTVYGIGCDPSNNYAVSRIYSIKGRENSKALPVLVRDLQAAEELVVLGPTSRLLAENYWPGGLTIIAPVRDDSVAISKLVSAGTGELAIRVPGNDCLRSVLSLTRMIVGTSANRSGDRPCVSAQEVINSGLVGFDVLLDGGLTNAQPLGSTIVREDALGGKSSQYPMADSKGAGYRGVRIVREGAISAIEIERFLHTLEKTPEGIR